MTIAILMEGETEKAFLRFLGSFLESRLAGRMPRLRAYPYHGRIPTGEKLRRVVEYLLSDRVRPVNAVVALTDVYTGSDEFADAAEAKKKMRDWVGATNTRFHAHAAQHDFEAWLLPYWPQVQRIAGHNRKAPGGSPEQVNHSKPPSYHIREIFRAGKCRDDYVPN